jgi:hypothetical protein
MSLDFYAYSNVIFQKNIFYDNKKNMIVDKSGSQHPDFKLCKVAFVSDDFYYHSNGITNNSVFKYDQIFHYNFKDSEYYGEWRNTLSKILQYNPSKSKKYKKIAYTLGAFDYDSGPFLNLICFSDCDGLINSNYCKEIYNDFVKYTKYVSDMPDEQFIMDKETFIEIYDNIKKCFEIGSTNGLVQLC